MKSLLKDIFGWFIRFSGIECLIRYTLAYNRATILLYHNPGSEVLDRHLTYLRSRYNFIVMDQLISAYENNSWESLPKRAMIITIDDGYKENQLLVEVLKKYQVKPTLYICSGYIDTNRKFWFDNEGNIEKLKFLPEKERLHILKKVNNFEADKEYTERTVLNSEELKDLADTFDIQSHSIDHRILIQCNPKDSKYEIFGSKDQIEKIIDKQVAHFSFPNGDYSLRDIQLLKSAGYKSARTCDLGWNGKNTDRFRLKAMGIQDDASINVLSAQISGIFGYLRFIANGSFSGKKPPLL